MTMMKQELKDVADAIEVAADRLVELLNRADDLLQSEDMPEPWDRWDEAVSHCQSASADISVSEDIDATVDALRAASEEAEE